MAKYEICFTKETWFRMTIEADSYEDARDRFWNDECDWSAAKPYGSEIQDVIDITLVPTSGAGMIV